MTIIIHGVPTSEVVIIVEHEMSNFSAISWREQITF